MSRKSTSIAVESNNQSLVDLFVKWEESSDLKFQVDPALKSSAYCVYLADLSCDLAGLSQDVIHLLQACTDKNIKVAICLLFAERIDTEKVTYLKNLLKSLHQSPSIYRLLLVKDLYQDVVQMPVTYLDHKLFSAIKGSIWQASAKGKNQLFPLYITDFISVLVKTLFLTSTSGKSFWIFGDKYTDLELGFILKSILADEKNGFEIEATLPNHLEESQFFSLGNDTQIALSWRPDTSLEQKLKSITESYLSMNTEIIETENNRPKSKLTNVYINIKTALAQLKHKRQAAKIKNKFLNFAIKSLLLILLAYLSTAGVFAWSMYNEYKSLNKSLDLAAKGDLEESVKEIKNLKKYNSLSQFTYEPLKSAMVFVNSRANEELVNLFAFNSYLVLSLENLQQTYVLADKIYKSIHAGQADLNPQESALALQSNLALVYDNLLQINISLESNKLPAGVVSKIKQSDQYSQLSKIQLQLAQAIKLTEIIPIILNNQTARLGVLIQDQDELRPTGGVIKQLLVFTFQNGKLIDTKSWLPENIDTVADGTASPPQMILGIQEEKGFKFKDMNYAADYAQTAQYITWFLERTIGLKLDTLVGVNKTLFEKMLLGENAQEIAGKVYQSKDIRSSNSEVDASKPVVDHYSTSFSSGKLPVTTLARAMLSEFEEGNIKLYAKDEKTQAVLSRLSISGIVADFPCPSGLGNYQNCLSQTTYLNEANFTFSPLNHSLKRELLHSVIINKDKFSHEYTLRYSFQSDFTSLGRDYLAIYQLFAPSGSVLTSISTDGQTPLLNNGIIKLKHGSLEYFQIPVSFSPDQHHEVKIAFDSPIPAPFDPAKTALSFTEIRQPGLMDKGTLLSIRIPENTKPLVTTGQIQIIQGSLVTNIAPQTTTFGLGLGF